MNDALRIAVAEAGLQAAHVKSTKGPEVASLCQA